jgi:hypothetical protein
MGYIRLLAAALAQTAPLRPAPRESRGNLPDRMPGTGVIPHIDAPALAPGLRTN